MLTCYGHIYDDGFHSLSIYADKDHVWIMCGSCMAMDKGGRSNCLSVGLGVSEI